MADKFAAITNLLSCPDDGAPLYHGSGEFLCSSCARRFPIYEENLAEILPECPRNLPPAVPFAYRKGYAQAFRQEFSKSDAAFAWGAEETAPPSWARKRRRQVAVVQPLIAEETSPNEATLCDLAAGAGYYTLAYAHLFRLVIHCDLSVDNLNYVWRKAHSQDLRNVFFLRMDYFAPPFRRSLDRIICLDTLIRGEAHDLALLEAISLALKPAGCAVVDFHNWWHNPLRRLGFLRENFAENRSYAAGELPALLTAAGIDDFEIRSFIQELNADGWSDNLLKRIIPPTRFLVRLRAPAFQDTSEAFERAASM